MVCNRLAILNANRFTCRRLRSSLWSLSQCTRTSVRLDKVCFEHFLPSRTDYLSLNQMRSHEPSLDHCVRVCQEQGFQTVQKIQECKTIKMPVTTTHARELPRLDLCHLFLKSVELLGPGKTNLSARISLNSVAGLHQYERTLKLRGLLTLDSQSKQTLLGESGFDMVWCYWLMLDVD